MRTLFKSERLSKEKECEALIDRNSEYHLSGDLGDFFRCAITKKACLGKIILDEDDQTSQFFSRAHAKIDMDRIKRCPLFGLDKEDVINFINKRQEIETKELINKI